MNAPYWESTRASQGCRAPRMDAPSSARRIDLNGVWRFRLSPSAQGTGDAFTRADFDDTGWDEMPVPSHWVLEPFTPLAGGAQRSMRGTPEGPLYTNTAYPIPLDPPHVPEENPTGDYRRVFEVPTDFGAAVLRLRGVDSCAKVWLNGQELGWANGSRLPFEFDAPVRPGTNVLAVRVHRWSSGTYLEDQDMWWLPGIFRDVELIERPKDAIDDVFVHADFDPTTGYGTLRVDASVPAVVEIPELGVHMPTGQSTRIPVEPWSADRPRLYRGSVRSAGEVVPLAIGFRRVDVVDGVLHANGRPLFLRGVNRHEHDPERGRSLDEEAMRRDILMMKRANIDAVRTSHYPPHPTFLRLCDELGMWVVEECDLETHGFIFAGWAGNPPADPTWWPALSERLERMVERDKNHPSVIIWSLANESDAGEGFARMRAWLRERDPSRPVLYERDPSYRHSDFYSLMYPSLDQLDAIGRREEPRPDGIDDDDEARRRSLPFLLVEYAHAMGNGPGSLLDYQRIMRSHPRICGGFVWEWIDHGFHTQTPEGTAFIMHGDDVADYEPRGGRFSLHGLVFSDRTPTPGLIELAKAYEPVTIEVADRIRITNRRHAVDTADLRFTWSLATDGNTVVEGTLEPAPIAAGDQVVLDLPRVEVEVPPGERVWTVRAELADQTSWAPAGHLVAWSQGIEAEPHRGPAVLPASDASEPAVQGETIVIGPARFDARTGRLTRVGELVVDGPWLDLYRAPTENDHGQGELNDIASVWQATGMDRLQHRVDAVEVVGDALCVRGRTAPSAHPHGAEWTMTWQADGQAVRVEVDLDFVGPWADTPYRHRDVWVPRVGLLFRLPGSLQRARWYGRGPGETYIDSYEGSAIGLFDRDIDQMQTPYPVPQENGNHVHTRWVRVTDAAGAGLSAAGNELFDFTVRRWRSHDLQRAAHPHELVDSGHVWLNLDHRQQGIGSASVGPELPERFRVPRRRTRWSLVLRAQ